MRIRRESFKVSVGGKVRMENSERGREAAVLEPVAHRLVHQIPVPLTY